MGAIPNFHKQLLPLPIDLQQNNENTHKKIVIVIMSRVLNLSSFLASIETLIFHLKESACMCHESLKLFIKKLFFHP